MKREECRHCVALVEVKGKWHCDEANLPIEEVDNCREWLKRQEEETGKGGAE